MLYIAFFPKMLAFIDLFLYTKNMEPDKIIRSLASSCYLHSQHCFLFIPLITGAKVCDCDIFNLCK